MVNITFSSVYFSPLDYLVWVGLILKFFCKNYRWLWQDVTTKEGLSVITKMNKPGPHLNMSQNYRRHMLQNHRRHMHGPHLNMIQNYRRHIHWNQGAASLTTSSKMTIPWRHKSSLWPNGLPLFMFGNAIPSFNIRSISVILSIKSHWKHMHGIYKRCRYKALIS